MAKETETLPLFLRSLLAAAVRFALKHSFKIQDVVEHLKLEFMRQALEACNSNQNKASHSKLSVVTGLRRREVARIQDGDLKLGEPRNLVARVIALWQQDKYFLDSDKNPRPLSYLGQDSEFHNLVAKISRELNAASVLFELERVTAVEKKNNLLHLKVHNYIPRGDAKTLIQILQADHSDLACAVEHNIFDNPAIPNLHLRTEYDRVRIDQIDELKKWFLLEGHEFHLKARAKIAQFDQDVNPDTNYQGRIGKVMLCGFSNVVADPSSDKDLE